MVKEEGFLALYKGVLPNMQRAIAVNGPGIAAFDHSKHLVGRLLGEEGSFRARFMASLVGGVAGSAPSQPHKSFPAIPAQGFTAADGTYSTEGGASAADCDQSCSSNEVAVFDGAWAEPHARAVPCGLDFVHLQ